MVLLLKINDTGLSGHKCVLRGVFFFFCFCLRIEKVFWCEVNGKTVFFEEDVFCVLGCLLMFLTWGRNRTENKDRKQKSLKHCHNTLFGGLRKHTNSNCWFLAESLGLPYLSAYLDSVGSNFNHGANFATAGSTIRPQNTTMSQSGYSPISLDVQFVQFSDFHRRSQIFNKKG
jgi:hypothetical protein